MKWKQSIVLGKYRKFKNSKISPILEKTLAFSIICSKFQNEDENIFKEEQSIEIFNIFGLIKDI